MWGDFYLIKFYPRNWQTSMFRSNHPLLLHTTLWHYWLWFTFIFSMNLFFIYIYKTISYHRSDIKGLRSNSEKRRLAWPEMLIVVIPIYWAINIVTNALAYLRCIEVLNGKVTLNVQVNGFQWGWRYCYSDHFYFKHLNSPVKLGLGRIYALNGTIKKPFIANRNSFIPTTSKEMEYINWVFYRDSWERSVRKKNIIINKNAYLEWKNEKNKNILVENYFSRSYLKDFGKIANKFDNEVLNKKFQHGYWVTSQGVEPLYYRFIKKTTIEDYSLFFFKIHKQFKLRDNLRLLKTSNSLILPTRCNVRLLSCSDDTTHSWAVPSLGFKMDCVPGRLFALYLNIVREGIYFGQCSELCGWNHYNMPISLYALSLEHFIVWWEIEIHSLFSKNKSEFYDVWSKKKLFNCNYKLINYKYK